MEPQSSPPLPKLCIVGRYSGEYGLLIVDLNDDVHRPTADDGYEFEARYPKIRVLDFGRLCFCVVKSTVYMFAASVASSTKDDCGHNSVYIYDLPQNVLDLPDFILEKSMAREASPLQSLKHLPSAIPCEKGIVVYSNEIVFANRRRSESNLYDFELYDFDGKKSKKLPPLSIRLLEEDTGSHGYPKTRCYELCDFKGIVMGRFRGKDIGSSLFFFLEGSSITDTNKLVVQAEIGQVFTLNLESPDEGWKLFTDGTLMMHNGPFFVLARDHGGICVFPGGAYSMEIQDSDSKKRKKLDYKTSTSLDLIDRCVPLPMTGFETEPYYDIPYDHQVRLGLAGGYACVVEMLIHAATNVCPHFVIDVVRVDFSKFPKQDMLAMAGDEEKEWAVMVKTHKIYLPWTTYSFIIHSISYL